MGVASTLPPASGSLDDAAVCEQISVAHARTFALASHLLPRPKRRAAFALYAFCRTADDLVDATTTGTAPGTAAQALQAWHRAVITALDGDSDHPVLRELHLAVDRFHVPRMAIEDLLAGVRRDLAPARYQTWPELARYCESVASSVGEMCVAVFGVSGGEVEAAQARGHARTLGLAMQLTNILRDVGEDAARGRCYLPSEELAAHGLAVEDVLEHRLNQRRDSWQHFMAFQIARARRLYREALPGIPLLHADAQRCALACASGYAEILSAIERIGYATFARRAVVRPTAMLRILTRSWLRRVPATGSDESPSSPGTNGSPP